MNKNTYYLNIAKEVSKKSTCLRRQYGAVLVKNDEIIATGYNGAPRGCKHCSEIGCEWEHKNMPHGSNYELCRSVHAEQNCIISASRKDAIGSTLYLYGENADGSNIDSIECCLICKKLIINAGIHKIVAKSKTNKLEIVFVKDWLDKI